MLHNWKEIEIQMKSFEEALNGLIAIFRQKSDNKRLMHKAQNIATHLNLDKLLFRGLCVRKGVI